MIQVSKLSVWSKLFQIDSEGWNKLRVVYNLKKLDLTDMYLRNQDFSGFDLSEVDFTNSKLSGTRFENANLNYSIFEGAEMVNVNLNDASMVEVQGIVLNRIRVSRQTVFGVWVERVAQATGYDEDLSKSIARSASFWRYTELSEGKKELLNTTDSDQEITIACQSVWIRETEEGMRAVSVGGIQRPFSVFHLLEGGKAFVEQEVERLIKSESHERLQSHLPDRLEALIQSDGYLDLDALAQLDSPFS